MYWSITRTWPAFVAMSVILILPISATGDSDLPPPAEIQKLTDQALQHVLAGGFSPWIIDVRKCYAALAKNESVDRRVFCVQLDAAAFAVERTQPADFQKLDSEINDFFRADKFLARQLDHTPPFLAANSDLLRRQKTRNHRILERVLEEAMARRATIRK